MRHAVKREARDDDGRHVQMIGRVREDGVQAHDLAVYPFHQTRGTGVRHDETTTTIAPDAGRKSTLGPPVQQAEHLQRV